MMDLPVEKRRTFFKKVYTLELQQRHITGRWFLASEKLPLLVEKIMNNLEKRRAPAGPAFDEVKRLFGLRSNKEIFDFLGY